MSALQQWTPTTLGELLIFTGGSQPPLSVFSKIEHEGYIRLIQIRDYKTDKYTTYIPKDLARRFCDADDIMIGRYGPPIFQILRGLEGAYNVALIKVTPKGNILKDFAWHYLRNDRLFKHIDKLSRRTSGQTGVDLNELENYPIQLPPLAEQQKIAQALTDADDYISALEKLIEKKKMIKEGLMVNLLTGKQRLKEFAFNEDGTEKGYKDSELGKIPEDWDLKYFTDVFSFLSTASFSRDQLTTEENTSACIHYGDIHTKLDYFIDTNSFISGYVSASQVMNYVAIQQGDLIIADASEDLEGIGKSVEVLNQPNIKVVSGLHTFLARDSKENFALGFRSFISSNPLILKQYKRLASGLKVYSLSKSTFKNILLPIPPKGEQESISKILFNHIQEITILNKKLEKAKAIKIGMMQKLLTGEIRLA